MEELRFKVEGLIRSIVQVITRQRIIRTTFLVTTLVAILAFVGLIPSASSVAGSPFLVTVLVYLISLMALFLLSGFQAFMSFERASEAVELSVIICMLLVAIVALVTALINVVLILK